MPAHFKGCVFVFVCCALLLFFVSTALFGCLLASSINSVFRAILVVVVVVVAGSSDGVSVFCPMRRVFVAVGFVTGSQAFVRGHVREVPPEQVQHRQALRTQR